MVFFALLFSVECKLSPVRSIGDMTFSVFWGYMFVLSPLIGVSSLSIVLNGRLANVFGFWGKELEVPPFVMDIIMIRQRYILFYFISFANRQGHRNSLRQLLRARN